MTTGEIPMVTEFEEIDSNLWVKEAAGWQPDKLLDDRTLLINAKEGLVVILGCAHRGIINTLYYAQQLAEVKKIQTVVGGCHLMRASRERVDLNTATLKELDVQMLGVSHCTGLPAASIMAQEFGDRFFFNNAGTIIEL